MSANETPLSDVRFLTVAEVASIMRLSKMTVYRMVADSELSSVRIRRSIRIRKDSFEQYLESHEDLADAETARPPAG